MKILARRIAEELNKAKHYAVYEPDLTRIWPDPKTRETEIASFARHHGWNLRYYKEKFVAIFVRELRTKRIQKK